MKDADSGELIGLCGHAVLHKPVGKATDKIAVIGTSTLLAGAIQQVCTGDFSQAMGNRVASIGGDDESDIAGSKTVTVGKYLIEKIGQIRKSVAVAQQQIIALVV
ncbi:hypothetical protein [Enterobacter sp.]|uniref:hypothetical protein n=1 Tax=Enterobacter TaxID=547 RepID=UPI00378398FF